MTRGRSKFEAIDKVKWPIKAYSATSEFATVCPIAGAANPAIEIISPAPAASTVTILVPFFFMSLTT